MRLMMMAEREMRGVCEKGMGGELRAHTQTHAGRYIMRERGEKSAEAF